MHEPRELPEELAEALVAGQLAEDDADAAARAFARDQEAERGLAGVLLVHGLLAGSRAEPETALAAIERRLAAERSRRSRLRRSLAWAAGAAAVLVLAGGVALYFALRPPAAARLVSGRLDGLPPDATTIPIGQAISTTEAAAFACQDGSQVEMAPGSTLTVHGRTGADRWRVELARGEVRCTVPDGQRPFRVRTYVADVVTEGTRFSVRLSGDTGGVRGMAVTVAEGQVRVEQQGLASVRVGAGGLRLFPTPSSSAQAVKLAVGLLFPGERVQRVESKVVDGVIEIEGWIRAQEVEVELKPDGTVLSTSRELPAAELPGALPAAVRRAVEAKFGPQVEWLEAEIETRGGAKTYEVGIRAQGKEVELHLDANGNVIRKEDDDRD